MKLKRLVCLAMLVLWLGAGCAKPPYEQLEAAEEAVAEARTLGAPIYLPDDFSALEDKLETAKEEISAQYKISEFRRDYSRAADLLMGTRTEGERIIAETAKRKEEAKAAALKERDEAKEAVHKVRELVGRVEQTDPSPIQSVPGGVMAEADELNRTLAEVQTAIEADNHLVAQHKAKAVQEKSHKLQSEVQERLPKPAP